MGRRSGLRFGTAALVGMVVFITACGGDDAGSAKTTAPGTSTSATATPVTAAPTAAPTTAATTIANFDESAARAEVTAMWEKFFDKATSVDDRIPLVEDGTALTEAIGKVKDNQFIGQATATVKRVTFEGATKATVLYDILVGTTPALPDAQGVAVLTDDGWKVSKETFCGLASLALGVAPPGC